MNAVTSEAPRLQGRILIVDDDPAMRLSLHGLLSDDFAVDVADGVSSGEALMATGAYDVVLSDYEMPGQSGMEFLRRMNTAHPGTIGILVTGHADHPDVRAAERDETIVRVITKPYDPARLIRWVENAVRLAKLRQATNALAARTRRAR